VAQTITVYCSSSDAIAEVYRDAARELGRLIAQRGYNLTRLLCFARSGWMCYLQRQYTTAG